MTVTNMRLLPVLLVTGLAGSPLSLATDVQGDALAQCTQEAIDYQIAQEQQADYIDNCILSRGGSLAEPPAAGIPQEPAMSSEPPAGDAAAEGQDGQAQ